MATPIRVVHYINQFFAGKGGEEKADTPPGLVAGTLGPSRGLQQQLGTRGEVVATIYCGDNYFHEAHHGEALAHIVAEIGAWKPHVFVAGPAFEAGRYGVACAEVCQAVATELGIPCVMAASPENAGVITYQGYKNLNVFCWPTTDTAAGMGDALARLAKFVERLASGAEIGPAASEGYIPRGIRRLARADKTGVQRAIAMLLAKVHSQPYVTEVPIETPDRVAPAPAIQDLSRAKIAVATTCGLVPQGNPDGLFTTTKRWAKYSIAGLRGMQEGKWEVRHSGYHTAYILENPNLGVPTDVLREMEDGGTFASLNDHYYASNNSAPVPNHQAAGREMGEALRSEGIEGVILVST